MWVNQPLAICHLDLICNSATTYDEAIHALPEATHGGPLSVVFLASPSQGRPPSDGEARIAPAPCSKFIKGLQRDVALPLPRQSCSDATGGMSGTDTKGPART
jgi:hypothetical protein